MRRPWFKFYTSDWRGDAKLQGCSIAARGLWIDILCMMHEVKPYGHLLIDGKPPSYYRISQLVKADYRVVKNLMAQLKKAGVFTGDITSGITSRRMVRDEAKRHTARELSKKRWGDLPHAPESRKKERGPTKESKGRKTRQAEQAWQRDMLRTEGPDGFAKAIDLLAANPALVERATRAELRQPGSGVMAAVIGLKRLREVAS
jgi:hypothetical protein